MEHMAERDTNDPQATGVGRRRAGGVVDDQPEAVGAEPVEPAVDDEPASGAAGTMLGVRRARSGTDSPAEPTADETRLGARRRAGGAAASSAAASSAASSSGAASSDGTRLGRRRSADDASRPAVSSTAGPDDEVVRFGPGVPASGPASPSWGQAVPRRRRRRNWLGGLVTLAIVAVVVAWLLLQHGDPLVVRGAEVHAVPATAGCDTTVDVVGTVTTGGGSGILRYQWLRSDGQTSEILTQSVAKDAAPTPVHLQWSVSGHGHFDGRATLRVLEPSPTESSGTFTYSCS
jgi:hypothetical protein